MNEEIVAEPHYNLTAQLLNQLPAQEQQDYGATNENAAANNEDGQSQMGESVLYRDLFNQTQQERIRTTQKQLRTKIVAIFTCLILLLAATLLVNQVGVASRSAVDDGLCGIDIQGWYIVYTIAVGLKLLVTVAQYHFLKKDRLENIPLYLTDLIGMNFAMTAIFIKANMMYFSDQNSCWYTTDDIIKQFYIVFCVLTILGYLQFIWCILISCSVPLSAFLIYQLVENRLNVRGNSDSIFGGGLISGLMQVPLPIPEILSSLSRTKFQQAKDGIQTQCAICWMDFKDKETVTPLLCDERHLYHTKCIEAWIRKGHNTCPLCRKQIANVQGV